MWAQSPHSLLWVFSALKQKEICNSLTSAAELLPFSDSFLFALSYHVWLYSALEFIRRLCFVLEFIKAWTVRQRKVQPLKREK